MANGKNNKRNGAVSVQKINTAINARLLNLSRRPTLVKNKSGRRNGNGNNGNGNGNGKGLKSGMPDFQKFISAASTAVDRLINSGGILILTVFSLYLLYDAYHVRDWDATEVEKTSTAAAFPPHYSYKGTLIFEFFDKANMKEMIFSKWITDRDGENVPKIIGSLVLLSQAFTAPTRIRATLSLVVILWALIVPERRLWEFIIQAIAINLYFSTTLKSVRITVIILVVILFFVGFI